MWTPRFLFPVTIHPKIDHLKEFSSEEQSEFSSDCRRRSSKHFINQILSETVPVFYGKLPADLRTNITTIQGNNQHSRLRSVLVTFVLIIVPELKPI